MHPGFENECYRLKLFIHTYLEIPFQSHREERIKRKRGKEVQEIEPDTLQYGREVRPQASEE